VHWRGRHRHCRMSGIFSFSFAAFRVLSLFLHCAFQLQHNFLLFLVVAKQSIKFSVGYYPELTVSQISKSSVRAILSSLQTLLSKESFYGVAFCAQLFRIFPGLTSLLLLKKKQTNKQKCVRHIIFIFPLSFSAPKFFSHHHHSAPATTKQCRRPDSHHPVNLPVWYFISVFFFFLSFFSAMCCCKSP
jgi:hypothetical protein